MNSRRIWLLWRPTLKRFRSVERNIRASEERYRARAEKRGKLLPRERLAHLLDPGAPFRTVLHCRLFDEWGQRWVNSRQKYHCRHWLRVGAPSVGDCVELRD